MASYPHSMVVVCPAAVLGQCTVSVDPVVDEQVLTKSAHFDHVIGGLGLQTIEAELL